MGGATKQIRGLIETEVFQPTRPVGGATNAYHAVLCHIQISTHAPRGGRDEKVSAKMPTATEFQPTRPVGGATIDQVGRHGIN